MTLEIIAFSVYLFGLINLMFNRRSIVSTLLFLVLLIVVMGGNNLNQDYLNYGNFYSGLALESIEPGFKMLMTFGHLMNLTYDDFRFLICAFSLLLMWAGIQRMTSKMSYKVYILYCIYPFCLDIIQLRNFIMMAILIFATSFLKERKFYNELVFTVLVLVGTTIQTLGIVYLLAVILYRFDKKDHVKVLIIFTMSAATIISMFPFTQSILSNIILNNGIDFFDKADSYSTKIVQNGYVLYLLADYLLLMVFLYIRKHTIDRSSSVEYELQTAVYSMITVATIFFPLYTINLSFNRAFRNVIPLLIINEIVFLPNLRNDRNYVYIKLLIVVATLTALLLLFTLDIFPLFGFDFSIFHANWLIH